MQSSTAYYPTATSGYNIGWSYFWNQYQSGSGWTDFLNYAQGGAGGFSLNTCSSTLPPRNIAKISTNSLSLGLNAGRTGQDINYAIAIGVSAGEAYQANQGVAIGYQAGQTNQGAGSIAIGNATAFSNQGGSAVAIGNNAGQNYQSVQAIAIGLLSGQTSQGQGAVAIGNNAGAVGQGLNSVAIGSFAGQSSQANNSIILNASGGALNASNSGFFCSPIGTSTGTKKFLEYNTTTKEITYNNILGTNSNAISSVDFLTSSNASSVVSIFENTTSGLLNIGASGTRAIINNLFDFTSAGSLRFLYTTLPTLTTASIGYNQTIALSSANISAVSPPSVYANISGAITLPAGVYQIDMYYTIRLTGTSSNYVGTIQYGISTNSSSTMTGTNIIENNVFIGSGIGYKTTHSFPLSVSSSTTHYYLTKYLIGAIGDTIALNGNLTYTRIA
jgi:hypothetical protein